MEGPKSRYHGVQVQLGLEGVYAKKSSQHLPLMSLSTNFSELRDVPVLGTSLFSLVSAVTSFGSLVPNTSPNFPIICGLEQCPWRWDPLAGEATWSSSREAVEGGPGNPVTWAWCGEAWAAGFSRPGALSPAIEARPWRVQPAALGGTAWCSQRCGLARCDRARRAGGPGEPREPGATGGGPDGPGELGLARSPWRRGWWAWRAPRHGWLSWNSE